MQYLVIGIRCTIGVVFLVSSFSKVTSRTSFGAFVTSLRDMRVLPAALVVPSASSVVVGEFAVCVLLAVPAPAATTAGFALAATWLTVFTTVIAVSMRRGEKILCRCFGRSVAPLGPRHIARNVALAAIAALGLTGLLVSSTAHTAGGTAQAVLAGCVVGGLVARLDDILDLFWPVNKLPGARGAR